MTIKTMADDLEGLLSALAIDRAHILGTSFGGFVAQEFAIAHPQMTRSLVLCCTSFGGLRHLLPSMSTLQAMAVIEGAEERTSEFSDGVFTKNSLMFFIEQSAKFNRTAI